MSVRIYVRTKSEIAYKLRDLADMVADCSNVSDVEEFIHDELGQLQCDLANRSAIERGDIVE